ncbi:MAG TPA: GAF and ANTAR domain-containing protein [Kineosporiaceae bacterium]|nr:GAF and ANTAR domain-containing protein [Kineosporiaceae bacterium]
MYPNFSPPGSVASPDAGQNDIQHGLTVETLRKLGSIVVDEQPVSAVLQQIADLAALSIPSADEASVTMVRGSQLDSVAFSGRLGAALDERQYPSGFGPSLRVVRTGRTVSIDDTSHSQRFPGFAYQAHRNGITHVLSLRLRGRQELAGVLTIYGSGSTPFDLATRDTARVFADHAAPIALNCLIHALALEETVQLRQALTSRAVIEQAKGIVMRELLCGPDDAFAFLSEASAYTGRKVRDIAQELVRNTREATAGQWQSGTRTGPHTLRLTEATRAL